VTKTASNPPLTPRWKVVYDELVARLSSFEYGSRFYSISELCREWDISSITAVRVLNDMAQAGLIEKQPRVGHRVIAIPQAIHLRLVVPTFKNLNPVVSRLLNGINDAARQRNLPLSHISEQHLLDLFPRTDPQERDGFIVFQMMGDRYIDFLAEKQLPYVLLDPFSGYQGRLHARSHRSMSGYLATRHLLELGHRRIAWITGALNHRNFRQRIQGYRKALAKAAVPFDWDLIEFCDPDVSDQTARALDRLMQLRHRPTAIIAGDDSRSLQLLTACRERGITVPGDLSIVGYPDYPVSRLADPPLTVVDACFEQVAEAAVELLLNHMLKPQAVTNVSARVTPKLVVRGSTAPPGRSRSAPSNGA
jgi:DNA-binding LacI/PurR family transcriptional regulator